MSEGTIAPERPDGTDPDAAMRKLKEQAAYGAALAASLTAGNEKITAALAELSAKRTEVATKDTAYRAQKTADFGKLRERLAEVLSCQWNSLGKLAPLAEQVVRRFRQDVAEAGRDVNQAQLDAQRAQEQVDAGAKELDDKKVLLDQALKLPEDLTAGLAALLADEAKITSSATAFEKYARATEIVRQLEEEIWVPTPDEYRDLVFRRWGEVVEVQQRLLAARAQAADREGRLKQAQAALAALTADRVAQLLERFRQARDEQEDAPVKEAEWGTAI